MIVMVGKILFSFKHVPMAYEIQFGDFKKINSHLLCVRKRSILALWSSMIWAEFLFKWFPPLYGKLFAYWSVNGMLQKGIFGWGNVSSTISLEQTFICDMQSVQCGIFFLHWSRCCILWTFNNENLLIYINGGFIGYCSGSNIMNGWEKIVTILQNGIAKNI